MLHKLQLKAVLRITLEGGVMMDFIFGLLETIIGIGIEIIGSVIELLF